MRTPGLRLGLHSVTRRAGSLNSFILGRDTVSLDETISGHLTSLASAGKP